MVALIVEDSIPHKIPSLGMVNLVAWSKPALPSSPSL